MTTTHWHRSTGYYCPHCKAELVSIVQLEIHVGHCKAKTATQSEWQKRVNAKRRKR